MRQSALRQVGGNGPVLHMNALDDPGAAKGLHAADMAAIAQDPETRRWWAVTDAMQESLVDSATGSGGDVPWWLVSCRSWPTSYYIGMY